MAKFPFEVMFERQDILERLDISIPWGHYEIRVLRFHLTSFPPGRIIDFHNHSEFEFHCIPRGKGVVILEDHMHPLSEGMLYVTGPGIMHYQEASSEESMEELCLHLDIEQKYRDNVDPWEIAEADETMQKLNEIPLVPSHDYHQAMKCFLEAYSLCEGKYAGYYTSIKHLVIDILLKVVRAYDTGGIGTQAPVRDMLSYRYEFAIQYMEANHSTIVTLENVAEKLNLSSRQLQRVFNQVNPTQTFSRTLEDIRLQAVCKRLEETSLSIEQIAQAEGFTNANYLHTVFRKRIGKTPASYRNEIKQMKSEDDIS
ncbi:cupin domain-containing protein [Paenibacillus sp. CMAA1364]